MGAMDRQVNGPGVSGLQGNPILYYIRYQPEPPYLFSECALYAIISDVFPESTLARVTGMTGIGEGIIDMTLVLLTGVIVDRFSFLPVFFSGSALPIMSIAALFLLVRRCELIRFEAVNYKD